MLVLKKGDIMEKFEIRVNNLAKIYLYTDSEMVKNEILFKENKITKTIPASVRYIGTVDSVSENADYIIYIKGQKSVVNIDKENNISFLSLPENELFFPDLVYLAIGMLANSLQKKSLYFMQSSVVKYNDNGSIMILGDPNAGKTTIAYKLMALYGWSLVSNDNVLVGLEDNQFKTYGGTKRVQMRLGSINLHCPELKDKIPPLKPSDLEKSEWDVKVFIDDILESNGAKYADESTITDIYLVDTILSNKLFIREKEGIDKILAIYEHMTKQIRNNRYALVSFGCPLPSFEDEKYLQARYDMSKNIAACTNVYEAKGDIEQIVKRLKR